MKLRELLIEALKLCDLPVPKKTLGDIVNEGQAKMHDAVEDVIARHEGEINQTTVIERSLELQQIRISHKALFDSITQQQRYFDSRSLQYPFRAYENSASSRGQASGLLSLGGWL